MSATLELEPGTHRFHIIDRSQDVLIERLAGPERVTTAVEVSRSRFADGARVVVLARAEDFADALSAGPLAGVLDAPLLLTPGSVLVEPVVTELQRLGADAVRIVGGSAAVSEEVADALADMGLRVERTSGADRFATAAVIASEVGTSDGLYLARGVGAEGADGWPDALAAGAAGAVDGRPVLLTDRDLLPAATADALEGAGGDVVIVGGSLAVSVPVEDEITSRVPARRVAGATRFETAALLAGDLHHRGAGSTQLWMATGEEFADALAASGGLGRDGGVLVLVPAAGPVDGTDAASWLVSRRPHTVTILGGSAAVTAEAEQQIRALLRREP